MRAAYRLLSLFGLVRAAWRGPSALVRFLLRREVHGQVARWMR